MRLSLSFADLSTMPDKYPLRKRNYLKMVAVLPFSVLSVKREHLHQRIIRFKTRWKHKSEERGTQNPRDETLAEIKQQQALRRRDWLEERGLLHRYQMAGISVTDLSC